MPPSSTSTPRASRVFTEEPTSVFQREVPHLSSIPNSELEEHEKFWRDQYAFLECSGYRLRSRYLPESYSQDSQPSRPHHEWDDYPTFTQNSVDAIRISDNEQVFLQKFTEARQYERSIVEYLSSRKLRSDPKNHCVPVYGRIDLPEPTEECIYIMVYPFLLPFDRPKFETVGDVVEYMRQLFEALQFLHSNSFVYENFSPHHVMKTRTVQDPETGATRPPVYYLIDFSESCRSDQEARTVFDISGLGWLLDDTVVKPYEFFGFLKPFFREMTITVITDLNIYTVQFEELLAKHVRTHRLQSLFGSRKSSLTVDSRFEPEPEQEVIKAKRNFRSYFKLPKGRCK